MATESFADGALRVTYPDAFDPPNELHELDPGLRNADPLALAGDDSAALIVGALAERQFTLVRPLELAPAPEVGGTRMAPAESGIWTVDLDVAADENAVILLEHDGVVSWQLPTRRTEYDALPTRSEGRVARSTVSFELTVGDDASARRRTRGYQRWVPSRRYRAPARLCPEIRRQSGCRSSDDFSRARRAAWSRRHQVRRPEAVAVGVDTRRREPPVRSARANPAPGARYVLIDTGQFRGTCGDP